MHLICDSFSTISKKINQDRNKRPNLNNKESLNNSLLEEQTKEPKIKQPIHFPSYHEQDNLLFFSIGDIEGDYDRLISFLNFINTLFFLVIFLTIYQMKSKDLLV